LLDTSSLDGTSSAEVVPLSLHDALPILVINAGHFTALNAQAQTGHDSVGLPSANFIGGTYSVDDNLSLSLYYTEVDQYWDKLYRSEEHTSELQSRENLVCRLLLEKKKVH